MLIGIVRCVLFTCYAIVIDEVLPVHLNTHCLFVLTLTCYQPSHTWAAGARAFFRSHIILRSIYKLDGRSRGLDAFRVFFQERVTYPGSTCVFASVLMYLCTAINVRVYSRWVSPRHYLVDSMILLPWNPIKCHREFLSLQLIYVSTYCQVDAPSRFFLRSRYEQAMVYVMALSRQRHSTNTSSNRVT